MATIVIKIGGEIVEDAHALNLLIHEIASVRAAQTHTALIVHGGGKQITDMSRRLGISTTFKDGIRVTTKEEVDIVEMVLAGSINSYLVRKFNRHALNAVGISGTSAQLLTASPAPHSAVQTQYTVETATCNPALLRHLLERYLPVVAPPTTDSAGNLYNLNADGAALAIAESLQAEMLLFLTKAGGVLDQQQKIIPELSLSQAQTLIANNSIRDGMVAKLMASFRAKKNGVKTIKIANIVAYGDLKQIINYNKGTTIL